jgi:hypothetical protein
LSIDALSGALNAEQKLMPGQTSGDLRCPTCGARQAWAETCRRCKSDLRLLRAAAVTYEEHRRCCLQLLKDGIPERALSHARSCHGLAPGAGSRRLIALCHLLREDWADAWEEISGVLKAEQ